MSQNNIVRFKIAGGQIVPEIEIGPSETIQKLKEKIEEELDVDVSRQSLWFNERILRDNLFIRDYGFYGNPTLNLYVSPLPPEQKLHVLVKAMGSSGFVRVKETDSVRDLRFKIERYWGIQSLNFALQRLKVDMHDEQPLSAYYISEASEVELKVFIQSR